jgi:hypothetical protein
MPLIRAAVLVSVVTILLTACASTHPVDMEEPRRLVGTESSIRIDALITGDQITPGVRVPITWEITNQRSTSIAVADLVPETSFDAETNMFTVTIGSEVPGNVLLPRLVEIAPGEKKSFSGTANLRMGLPPRPIEPLRPPPPAGVRLKVNFLGDAEPFRQLIGIRENAVADSALADALFPLWLERNEAVYTNAVPMRWVSGRVDAAAPPVRRPRRP